MHHTLYLVVTIAFMIGLAAVGLFISRGVKSSEDWMVAGKSLGKSPMAENRINVRTMSGMAASLFTFFSWYNCGFWRNLMA